ncbi:hypothetical protein BVRB_021010 [Beta vulgaris subsp. vulgaris]|uniref:Uncharacterized protein n=1 Tax=Beta vulgaris subsp. vulgaris TaxID=3555 RepID=A0A0J8B3P7_BETVV|nr:hypothetical protein BVRB_021010 [Beta vulgaris subsp. vulgaris]
MNVVIIVLLATAVSASSEGGVFSWLAPDPFVQHFDQHRHQPESSETRPAAKPKNPLAQFRPGGSKLVQRALESRRQEVIRSQTSSNKNLHRSSSTSQVGAHVSGLHRTTSGSLIPDLACKVLLPIRCPRRFEKYSPGRITFAKAIREPLQLSRFAPKPQDPTSSNPTQQQAYFRQEPGKASERSISIKTERSGMPKSRSFSDAMNLLPQHALSYHLLKSNLIVRKNGKLSIVKSASSDSFASLN